jgi:hypothetical protein
MLRTPSRSRLVALLLAFAASLGCASSRTGERQQLYPPIESTDFGTINNVSKMGPIWFGAMPHEEDLDLASRRGVKRIIDLSIPLERGECPTSVACGRHEIEYLIAGIRPDSEPTDESVDLVVGWLRESLAASSEGTVTEAPAEPIPTLMICGSGGRCSMFFAIFRVVEMEVPLQVALEEARRGGMLPGTPAEFVRAQVKRLSESPDADTPVTAGL